MIRPFLTSLGCPEVLEKKLVPRAKEGRFKKNKKYIPRYSSSP